MLSHVLDNEEFSFDLVFFFDIIINFSFTSYYCLFFVSDGSQMSSHTCSVESAVKNSRQSGA